MDLKPSTVVFSAFYFIIHFVFTIYELTEIIYKTLRSKLIELCHEFVLVNRTKKHVKIEKIPRHLTFLLGTEEPSPKDLANLILWCLAAGISFVTFYDHGGVLKRNEEKLHQVVEKKRNASDHVIWHSHPATEYKNGYTGRKIHVKVLSGDDGTKSVVDVTKQFSQNKNKNLDINSFDEGLKRQFEFPEPDFGVCCGKTLCLDGYPPWQIRLTEFFTINSHHNVNFDKFVDLVGKYNKCIQRYGK